MKIVKIIMVFYLLTTQQMISTSIPDDLEFPKNHVTKIQEQDSVTYSRFKNGFEVGFGIASAVVISDKSEEFYNGTYESMILTSAACLWCGVVFGSLDVAFEYCSDHFIKSQTDVSNNDLNKNT